MRRKISKQLRNIISYTLVILSIILINTSVISAQSGLNVQKHTKEEVRNYALNNVNLDEKVSYSVSPSIKAPYKTGELSTSTLNSAIKTLNTMRYIAGISSDVKLKDSYNELAQGASLVNGINGGLTHYPYKPSGMSDSLYELCYKGASSSNIAMGYVNLNHAIVYGWMRDEDTSNIDRVGHRRWILNPGMKATGFGQVNYYTAMYSFDGDNSSKSTVAWPGQVMPTDYFDGDDPWSLSLGKTLDEKKIKVTLKNTKTNKVWNFSSTSADGYFNVENSYYGQPGCIIFRPDKIESYNDGDVYSVTITGLEDTITYNVEFFDLKPVTSITLNKTSLNMDMGNYAYLEKTIKPADASNQKVTWTTSNSKVATVDQWGEINAVGPGTATITATTVNGKKSTCTVTVKENIPDVDTVIGLNIIKRASTTIELQWNSLWNVSGYEVYRATSPSEKYTKVATIENEYNYISSYKDTGLKTGQTYYYKVRAYTQIGSKKYYGKYSSVVNGKTFLSKPTATASRKTYNSNSVTWKSVYGASGYEVYRATSEKGTYSLKKTVSSGSDLSYTNTGLTTGKTYYYKVRAYKMVDNKKVYSSYSTIVSAKPYLTKPTVTLSTSSSKANVKWGKIAGASGYEVSRSTSKTGTYKTIKTLSSSSTVSYTDKNVSKNKGYYYKVRAYRTINGKKVYSSYSSVKYIKVK